MSKNAKKPVVVYGASFEQAGPLLAPGLAHMYTTGEIAAKLCLETPGLDTLDIAVFWGGSPTIASTQTILVNAAMAKAYYLDQNQYVEWQPDAGLYNVSIPASTRPLSRCRGAAPRTRCGLSATLAWPTSRCWAASSASR